MNPVPPPPNTRRYPDRPLVGVGALIFSDDTILLVERGSEPLKGLWSLPGGLLEVGETLACAVTREVAEETGLRIEPLSVFEIFERIMRDADHRPEYHYVLIDYLCRVVGGDLKAATDVSEVAWVPQRSLGNYRLTEGTQAVIERAFAKLQL